MLRPAHPQSKLRERRLRERHGPGHPPNRAPPEGKLRPGVVHGVTFAVEGGPATVRGPTAPERLRRMRARQLSRRYRDEAAQRVRPQPPVALAVAGVDGLQGPEDRIDGVPKPLGRPAADGEVGPDVVQGQPAERPCFTCPSDGSLLEPAGSGTARSGNAGRIAGDCLTDPGASIPPSSRGRRIRLSEIVNRLKSARHACATEQSPLRVIQAMPANLRYVGHRDEQSKRDVRGDGHARCGRVHDRSVACA